MQNQPTPAKPSLVSRFLHNYWVQAAGIILLVSILRSSLFNHYVVPSGSMEPNLVPGDFVAVNMTAYGLSLPFTRIDIGTPSKPRRGDIAVFRAPDTGVRLIKRIVAVEGDRISLREGRLWLNGAPQALPDGIDWEQMGDLRVRLGLDQGGGPDFEDIQVPQGSVFVLGDHRGASADSRVFGFVQEDALFGRAVAVYYRRGDGLQWSRLGSSR